MSITRGAGTVAIAIAALLLGSVGPNASGQTPRRNVKNTRSLSAFEMEKAERLLREELPCLGCHELDGEGGRIGPSLSSLKGSRSPGYVFAMIDDPQATFPGTIMPRVPLKRGRTRSEEGLGDRPGADGERRKLAAAEAAPEATLQLIGSYLLQRHPSDGPAPDRLPRPTTDPPPDTAGGAALYAHYCAACHRAEGSGDGPNARYLPVRPVSHADSSYMSERPAEPSGQAPRTRAVTFDPIPGPRPWASWPGAETRSG